MYLKRKVDKPEVTRQGVDDAVKDIIDTVRRDRESGARLFARRFDNFCSGPPAPRPPAPVGPPGPAKRKKAMSRMIRRTQIVQSQISGYSEDT